MRSKHKLHILTLVTLTTGRHVSESLEDNYEALNKLLNDDLFTHQLIRALKIIKPYLQQLYPVFVEYKEDIDNLITNYGKNFQLASLDKRDELKSDFISEIMELTGLSEWVEVEEYDLSQYEKIDPFVELDELLEKR